MAIKRKHNPASPRRVPSGRMTTRSGNSLTVIAPGHEQAHYSSSTINPRLAAVRRLAYEAADCGLLSPDPAAGIRRVKGARKHSIRPGNWPTAQQGKRLLSVFDRASLCDKRD